MSIEGRAAIITGGGTGVGRATALDLARLGVSVAVNYSRSADEAAATARDCEAEGVEAVALQADVASNASVVAMVEQAAAALGRVDYLVNSAGTTVFVDHPDLDGLTEAAWQRVMGVNLVGAFYATRACAPHMRAAGAGAVVNVSSVAGITGAGSSIPYAASKGALNTMTRSLARARWRRRCASTPWRRESSTRAGSTTGASSWTPRLRRRPCSAPPWPRTSPSR